MDSKSFVAWKFWGICVYLYAVSLFCWKIFHHMVCFSVQFSNSYNWSKLLETWLIDSFDSVMDISKQKGINLHLNSYLVVSQNLPYDLVL